jgi:hypothetical protein
VVRLGRDTQQLLGVVAAAGPGVTGPLLAVVTGMGETELLDSLHEAVDQQLVLPEPGSRAGSARGGVVAPGFKPVRSERADGGGGEWLGRLGWRIQ